MDKFAGLSFCGFHEDVARGCSNESIKHLVVTYTILLIPRSMLDGYNFQA